MLKLVENMPQKCQAIINNKAKKNELDNLLIIKHHGLFYVIYVYFFLMPYPK